MSMTILNITERQGTSKLAKYLGLGNEIVIAVLFQVHRDFHYYAEYRCSYSKNLTTN